ncbi:hypothetical protein [Nocardia terpenica]|uniref:Uncharacterized protein n=1 Tax=Nocardia terpenica TaxID=455432 RepID=A0A6G9Z764_9NOCA|nr:hypothetical protein [Nocardia terpenica]QIS21006.1 hypothetical protein F6W96_24505 [Nocardia terpenica]
MSDRKRGHRPGPIRCAAAGLGRFQIEQWYGTAHFDSELARGALAELLAVAPPGWQRMEATFALTIMTESARAMFTVRGRAVQVEVPPLVVARVRRLRSQAATSEAGPWWRLLVRAEASGSIEVEYDYGDEPFPDGPLFPPEAYRADVAAYPRPLLPMWLAAYMFHDGRQQRTPERAAAAVRADRAAGLRAAVADSELPGLPQLWARWVTLAAAHVAVGSERGPRLHDTVAWFESGGDTASGSTLFVRPDGTAVLSGGVWNAPALNAAYTGGLELPNLYAGAPDWVTDEVLNPRASTGLLSFCFWWDGERWYRGESPSVLQCGAALPDMWAAETVVETIARLTSPRSPATSRPAAARLLCAVRRGDLSRDAMVAAFGADSDIDAAWQQVPAGGPALRHSTSVWEVHGAGACGGRVGPSPGGA